MTITLVILLILMSLVFIKGLVSIARDQPAGGWATIMFALGMPAMSIHQDTGQLPAFIMGAVFLALGIVMVIADHQKRQSVGNE